jgi:coenzyme F420-reducing hydrogenase beta subunit
MACLNICPNSAIHTEKDEYGFLYPAVDMDRCIQCGICDDTCDFIRSLRAEHQPIAAYSLVHSDPEIVSRSTSGGAFTALSDIILSRGGVIFGAALNEDFTVSHRSAIAVAERDSMRGSLYVQSDTSFIYPQVKDALEKGLLVLFVGAPCQIGGLNAYLQKPFNNLYTVEFLCHGVPNNDFFQEHVKFLEKKYRKKPETYSFRGKKYGWNHGIDVITFVDNSQRDGTITQSYSYLFQAGVSLRPSCLHCTYRRSERCADITIGDFWGIEKITGKKHRKGVSLLFTNNEKGKKLVLYAAKDSVITEIPVESVMSRIATVPAKSKFPTTEFWKDYLEKGYEELVKRYCDTSLKSKIILTLKKLKQKIHSGK